MTTTDLFREAGISHWPADETQPLVEGAVGDALRVAAAAWPDRIALTEGVVAPDAGRSWTFSDLLAEAEQVARALLGLFRPGERVVIWAPNRPEWILMELGAGLAGMTLVTANPAFGAAELRHVVKQSDAAGIFYQDHYRGADFASIIAMLWPEMDRVRKTLPLSSWDHFIASGSADRELPLVKPSAVAQIQYTSGTTGLPKGAQLTHRGLANNARFFAQLLGAGEDDVWINPMPLFHTAGCGLVTLGALQSGGRQVLPPAFDPSLMLSLFERYRGTLMLCVPTMLIRMLDAPEAVSCDLSSWRRVALGGAPVSPELVARARRAFGIAVAIGFGQTEASPYITHTLPSDDLAGRGATVGRAMPQTEIRIVDSADGKTLPLGEVGEICARGYSVMTGYLDAPAATATALDAEGWLHTGDLGSMDADGYCSVQGRLKDMIIRGGENVYPREIEDLLATHPAVADVYIVGIPDEEWGEIVAAYVRPKANRSASADELAAFCRLHLASFKIPRIWRFVTSFPQTVSGKVQKFALRAQLMSERSGRV